MNCLHCHRPVVLSPTATERARRFGGSPQDYTNMFQYHSACTLELRARGVSDLMKRIREKSK